MHQCLLQLLQAVITLLQILLLCPLQTDLQLVEMLRTVLQQAARCAQALLNTQQTLLLLLQLALHSTLQALMDQLDLPNLLALIRTEQLGRG